MTTTNDRPMAVAPAIGLVMLVLVVTVLPLVIGNETLFLRDLSSFHLPVKTGQALAIEQGTLPLIDASRGTQPLVGNPNTVPLYPDNVLYGLLPPLWAFNAHLWLHWLLAPFAMAWLARTFGLGRHAAWAAGTIYATSGFFVSQLNLYNLVAGAALVPAFVAAVVSSWGRGRHSATAGVLWSLLLLAGDPMTAALGLVLALSGALARHPARPVRPLATAGALALGTLVASPQVVAFLAIVPGSFRGQWSMSQTAALSQSFDPRSALEWLMPFAFGPPDLTFWGHRFFGGNEPLYVSLYPGVLALVLLAVAGRPRTVADRWGWGVATLGVLIALGSFNPIVRATVEVAGSGLLRYPIKVWPLVAVGLSLVCGLGFDRLTNGHARRRALALGAAVAVVGVLAALSLRGDSGLGARLITMLDPERLQGTLRLAAIDHWQRTTSVLAGIAAVLTALVWLLPRRPTLAIPLLLATHAAGQLVLLQPALARDDAALYRTPPPIEASVPSGAWLVHGRADDLFGPPRFDLRSAFPDPHPRWAQRLRLHALQPAGGVARGHRYDLDPSPEGLDGFLSVVLARVVPRLGDPDRLRLLASSGVDHLLLDRPLDPEAPARLVAHTPAAGTGAFLYALDRPAPAVFFATTVHPAGDVNTSVDRLRDPAFDPRTMAVIPGEGPSRSGGPGRLDLRADTLERIDAVVDSPDGGVLVVRRAYGPLWRATIDGAAAETLPANVHRLAIEVPAGRHEVRLWVERRPFRFACAAALVALCGLAGLGWREQRRPTAPASA